MEGEKMQYDKSFNEEALKLSDEIGVRAAAAQLGITSLLKSLLRRSISNNTMLINAT